MHGAATRSAGGNAPCGYAKDIPLGVKERKTRLAHGFFFLTLSARCVPTVKRSRCSLFLFLNFPHVSFVRWTNRVHHKTMGSRRKAHDISPSERPGLFPLCGVVWGKCVSFRKVSEACSSFRSSPGQAVWHPREINEKRVDLATKRHHLLWPLGCPLRPPCAVAGSGVDVPSCTGHHGQGRSTITPCCTRCRIVSRRRSGPTVGRGGGRRSGRGWAGGGGDPSRWSRSMASQNRRALATYCER
jgi:hypothetical protein